MHEELWAGVELKLQNAEFHFRQMTRSLESPERTATNVAVEASGAIIDTGWQLSFYAHLDAFLSAARSVAEIIKCCFGVDKQLKIKVDQHPKMKVWFNQLCPEEQDRRREFWKQFQPHYEDFRDLDLSRARNISVHRTGYPRVVVTISGRFGVTYTGGPATRVPISETRLDSGDLAWMDKPLAVRPKWDDFDIGPQGLCPACQDYLDGAQDLMNDARRISGEVHGTNSLTPPPSQID